MLPLNHSSSVIGFGTHFILKDTYGRRNLKNPISEKNNALLSVRTELELLALQASAIITGPPALYFGQRFLTFSQKVKQHALSKWQLHSFITFNIVIIKQDTSRPTT